MVRELIHDPLFLGIPSKTAKKEDISIGKDLLDTLISHKEECVGMAGNMIGFSKRIIAFNNNGKYMVMYNPEIIVRSMPFDTEESCLSLLGNPRKTVRYRKIKVRYQDEKFVTKLKIFSDFTAQIIQHAVDHCNGVLI